MTFGTHCHHHPDGSCHRNPLHCILPPHMLKELAEQGTPLERERAVRALVVSGQVRGQRQQIAELSTRPTAREAISVKQRMIYDAGGQTELPGRRIRGEGDPPTGDAAADEAYDGAGATFDLYQVIYGRNSIDDRGMDLVSTVHYGQSYDNAFWDGKQMTYGDGDEDLPESQRLFNRFTIAIDIIAHELTHGVTQYEAGLVYRNQPGALNESFSDVFGALVKQRQRNQTATEADWIIGEGLFTRNISASGIRSMKAPGTAYNDPKLGKDPQPAHMRDIYKGSDDNGGVHINSGIPNYAFYLTARELGGYAWEKAGRIWYITLRDKLRPTSTFWDAARETYQVAGELFGAGSLEQQAVRNGWTAVGLTVDSQSQPQPPVDAPGCLTAPMSILLRSFFG
jgi:Zn-dependent metalloprotease